MAKKIVRPSTSRRKVTGKTRTVAIASIKVGYRHRRDLGDDDDIAWLASSITDIGLLHPITVDENRRLLAGARRLTACKKLGWRRFRSGS